MDVQNVFAEIIPSVEGSVLLSFNGTGTNGFNLGSLFSSCLRRQPQIFLVNVTQHQEQVSRRFLQRFIAANNPSLYAV